MRTHLTRTIVLGLVAALLAAPNAHAQKTEAKSRPALTARAYLGVGVEALHLALIMHLPKTLIDGQGVMIARVESGSPAAKAGLKPHDILVTYDNQKLFSPEQLVKLIHADKSGRDVVLAIVRSGKLETHTVKLGTHPPGVVQSPSRHPNALWPWFRFPGDPPLVTLPRKGDGKNPWESFDSLNLKKLDGNHYQVKVEYLDKHGKTQHHEFTGTLAEIQKKIKEERDLPAGEKQDLLRGLNLHQPMFPNLWYPHSDRDLRRWYDWNPFGTPTPQTKTKE